jgi:imidazolonepropionase-like amidohydrolase
MPGLIDAHVHIRDADELRQTLRFGVTTVLDMGATVTPGSLFALRREAARSTEMSDVLLAGFSAAAPPLPAARPDPRVAVERPGVPTVEAAQDFVAARHTEGADYLKIILRGLRNTQTGAPNLDVPRVKALVDSAHARGMLAVAHVETLDDTETALVAGIDGLMHVWRQGGPKPELSRRLRDRGVFVVPVLATSDGFMSNGGRAGLLADPRFLPFLSPKLVEQLRGSFAESATAGSDAANRARFESSREAVRNLHDVGVKLLAATDAAFLNPTGLGISLHRELELLTAAGLTNVEALSSATMNAAEAFRLSDRGRILPGRRADLVLVRGNPMTDILATRDIFRIWKSGVEVDRGPVGRQ